MSKEEKPQVSVVIPTYNRANDLKRALESVTSQKYKNWEIVIVDNHSKDNTDEIINSFNYYPITQIKTNNNGIIAKSRNLGIEHAKGEYIAFLDSDDWWLPEKLEICLRSLKGEIDVVYHDLWMIQDRERISKKRIKGRRLRTPVAIDLLTNGNTLFNSSVVVRKSILEMIGRLDEDPRLATSEDFDAWLRIALKTERFKYIPKSLGYYWAAGGNCSARDMTSPINTVLEKHQDILDYEQRKQADAFLAYVSGRYAYLKGNKDKAKSKLSAALRHQSYLIKIKSLSMLFLLLIRKRVT